MIKAFHKGLNSSFFQEHSYIFAWITGLMGSYILGKIFYIGYHLSIQSFNLSGEIPYWILIFAFFIGVFIRSFIIVGNTIHFIILSGTSVMLLSLFSFQGYEPYMDYLSNFLCLYAIILGLLTVVFFPKKIPKVFNEQISMLISLSAIYAIIEKSLFSPWLIWLSILWGMFNIYHNLSKIKLSLNTGLLMSMISYFIISGFYIAYINTMLFTKGDVSIGLNPESLEMIFQYFIYGFGAVFLLDAFYKIYLLLPKKYESYSQDTFPKAREAHLRSFSNYESRGVSSICLLASIILFSTNYFFHIVSPLTVVGINISLIFVYQLMYEMLKGFFSLDSTKL